MAFPTIPTSAAGRILSVANTAGGATSTFPSLTGLTKNAGDLLIAIIVEYDGATTNAEFSSWGGGFTEFVDRATTTTMGIGAAYKWSTGSETGTFTVTTVDSSTTDRQMILLSIPGAHLTTPPEGGTKADGTSAAANIPAFNPAGWDIEDTLWIAVGGSGETSTTGSFTGIASAPTNYTDYFQTGNSADAVGAVEGAVAFRQLAAASDDPATFSVDLSKARNSGLLIAVRPAAAPTEGSSTGSIAWVGSATGTNVRSGAAIGSIAWVGSSTGQRVPKAAGSGAIAWAGTADGIAPVVVQEGAGIGAISWTGSATGTTTKTGTATGAVSWAGVATGAIDHEGTVTGTLGWVGSATGSTAHDGSADGTITWAGSSTGEAPTVGAQEGSADGAISWTGTAAGTAIHQALAVGALTWTGSADGVSVHYGTASGTVEWVGTATSTEAPFDPVVVAVPFTLKVVVPVVPFAPKVLVPVVFEPVEVDL